jgi:subtilisin family serine protease
LIGADVSGYAGTTATVAVLDSGVDSGHLHIWPLVMSEACYSTNEDSPSTPEVDFTSLCPGGVSEAVGTGTGEPCTEFSICSHGTHIAGIAAGGQFTGGTYQGVALAARLISIKVYSIGHTAFACYPNAFPCLRGKTSDEIKGLERVLWLLLAPGTSIVSPSFPGGGYSAVTGTSFAAPHVAGAFAQLKDPSGRGREGASLVTSRTS